jgi:hypothetical protein
MGETTTTTCSVKDCSGQVLAQGLCGKHYQRLRKLGSVDGYQLTICPHCGDIFRPRRRDQVYCSKACQIKVAIQRRPSTARPEVECRFCHRMFTPRGQGQVCYSESCQRSYHTEASMQSRIRARANRPLRECAECGDEFRATTHNKAYCSPACAREAHLRGRNAREYRPEPINCAECGQQIPYKSGKRRFCSEECHKAFVARDARWKVKGLTADHGLPLECGLCGATKRLDLDHDHACCPGQRSCGKCVRGFLCRPHNVGLGMFNDDPAQLRAAADYIERHRAALALTKEYVNG